MNNGHIYIYMFFICFLYEGLRAGRRDRTGRWRSCLGHGNNNINGGVRSIIYIITLIYGSQYY